jgi:hypothetical protein
MKKLFAAMSFALAICVDFTPAFAQGDIQVPPQQRALTAILSKYNDLRGDAPNDIQKDRIDSEFRKAFCAAIPKGDVSGWVGEVNSIDNDTPSKGIQLWLGVSTHDLFSGDLGVDLSLGNSYAYGVSDKNTKPHAETVIPISSPLYRAVSTLRNGDTVIFSGTFIPYSSAQACYENDTTYFSLMRFSVVRKIGWGITF